MQGRKWIVPALVLSFLPAAVCARPDAITAQEAQRIAIDNAGVPAAEVFNVKVESDKEGGEPVFAVEFETRYGDFDFAVSRNSGRVVDADCEIDEEWVRRQPAADNPEQLVRKEVVRRVRGAQTQNIQLRPEGSRWEGVLFHAGYKYEFEADRRTGILLDWTVDRRR